VAVTESAGSPCSSAYSLYANSDGSYSTPACAASAGPSVLSHGVFVWGQGVPACRLYPSGSQPFASTYGTGNSPVTPVPVPSVAVPQGGALVGASC